MPEDAERPSSQRSTIVLFALGLIWLAAYLWSAHASIDEAGTDALIAVFDAALALPGVVAATMLAGATAGVTALGWLRPRLAGPGGWVVSAVALVAGLIIGGLAGAMILLGYGHRSSIVVLAWAVVAAGAIGGILGSARPREMTSAGLAATIVAFLIGFVLNYKQDSLLNLFGAGASVQSRADALNRLTPTESLLAGVLAGIVAYLYLRRIGGGLQFWPRFWSHLAAGGMAGVILLLSEAVTRIGGGQLFGAAGASSVIDQTAVDYSSGARLNHGLIVLFTGAFVAVIAFGATIRRPAASPAAPVTGRSSTGRDSAGRIAAGRDAAGRDSAGRGAAGGGTNGRGVARTGAAERDAQTAEPATETARAAKAGSSQDLTVESPEGLAAAEASPRPGSGTEA